MKNVILFLLVHLSVALVSQSEINYNYLEAKASVYLEEGIDFSDYVGVTAGISHNGEIVWSDGSGLRDREVGISAEADMIHRIASISKPMTAIAILQLMEAGKLDLDDRVTMHLPKFPGKHSAITIRHLLYHTSGITAYKSRAEAFPTKNYASLSEAMDVFIDRPLQSNPGEEYNYTTYGYVVLGAVIEAASGTDYRSYMKKNIWEVAGMNNTDVEIFGRSYENKSKLYRKEGASLVADKETNLSVKVPGGGVQSTAEDLLKFGQAVVNHKFLKPETFQLMITDSGKKQVGNPYALGWFLYGQEDGPHGRIIGHSGSQSGTSTQLMIYLDHGLVVSTLANTSDTWQNVLSLNGRLAELVLKPEVLEVPLRKAIPLKKETIDKYTGIYVATDDTTEIEIFRKENDLYSYKDEMGDLKLQASSASEFFAREMNLVVIFEENTMRVIESGDDGIWRKKDNKKSIARELYNIMVDEDSKAGTKFFNSVKDSPSYYLDTDKMTTIAYNLMGVGEIKEALDVFKLLHMTFPAQKELIDGEMLGNVARHVQQAGANKVALDFLEFYQEVYPSSSDAYYQLGNFYKNTGKMKKAMKNYEKALSLDGENSEARSELEKM